MALKNKERTVVQCTVGRSADGKRIRKSFYGKNKREARAKMEAWKKACSRDVLYAGGYSMKGFSTWVDEWLSVYKRDNGIREYTYQNTYKSRVEKYFKPYFGQRPLDSIYPIDVQKFFNLHRDLAQATLDTLKTILVDIFGKAIDNGLCIRNPAKNINPKSSKLTVSKRVYTLRQWEKAVDWCIEHEQWDVLTILKSGIRRGELLALKWTDIDFEKRQMAVNESMSPPVMDDNGNRTINYQVKTSASNRTIPIKDELAEYLSRIPRKSERVFPCKNANAYGKSIRRVLARMSEDCGIPCLTLHELRHTYATLLKEKGVDIYYIARLMWHADVRVTDKKYLHVDPEALRAALVI